MVPEFQSPLGTPLSSPATPLVPLVVEWKVAAQVHITRSPAAMVTTAGEKRSRGLPTVTLVLAANPDSGQPRHNKAAAAPPGKNLNKAVMSFVRMG